jgi:xylulose-5-phosphate/fructose-6-phosphate phosphoketolase
VAPETPGSIHEGGELGYSLSHAYGAAFDNPGLVVACVIGDGEAETGPLAASWHSNKFLNPRGDGAVLPILHLNGYKIANPTLLARMRGRTGSVAQRVRASAVLRGRIRSDHDASPDGGGSRRRTRRDHRIQHDARRARHGSPALADDRDAHAERMDRAAEVDGQKTEGHWRSHQVPLSNSPRVLRICRSSSAG